MAFFYMLPHWFFGYGIALELVFGLVTALIAYYAFKVYNLCDQRECKNLGWAFISISASYMLLLIIQVIAWTKLNASNYVMGIGTYSVYAIIGLYLHVIFMLVGFATLAYVTLGTKSQRAYSLTVTLSVLTVIFSSRVSLAFNFVAALLLLHVAIYYLRHYLKSKNNKLLLTLLGVSFLFIARVVFAFTTYNPVLYAVSHFIEFVGYTAMAVSLMKALR